MIANDDIIPLILACIIFIFAFGFTGTKIAEFWKEENKRFKK